MSTTPASIIGKPTPRIDGPLKTTGTAQYAADFHFDRMAHAMPVVASIAERSHSHTRYVGSRKDAGRVARAAPRQHRPAVSNRARR